MPRRHTVYRLVDPRPGRGKGLPEGRDIYYVGETVDPKARQRQHGEKKKPVTPAEARNQEILAEGYRPVLEALETFDTPLEALLYEIYYIIAYGKQGYTILNREEAGYVYEQARKLMGDARLHGRAQRKKPDRRAAVLRALVGMGLERDQAHDVLDRGWAMVLPEHRPARRGSWEFYLRGKIALTRKRMRDGKVQHPAGYLIRAIRENWRG